MTTTTETATAATELRHIDPNTLTIDANIRTSNAQPPADLIASIAAHGVLTPVRAVERDGVLHVQDGQLRTLAAREAARATIPVYVVPDIDGDKARTADRIITQWNSNEQREAMTARDKAAAVQQLSLAGVSATKIAKATHQRKKDIDATLAAAKSSAAMDALDSLTIDQAAILAEYDGDDEAIAMLMAAVDQSDEEFDRRATYLRESAAERAVVKTTRTALESEGITILDQRPRWNAEQQQGIYELHRIVALDTGKRPDINTIPAANRMAFVFASEFTMWIDSNGNEVDAEWIDEGLLDYGVDPDAQPDDGWIDPRGLTKQSSMEAQILWYIRDLDTAENLATTEQYRAAQNATPEGQAKVNAVDRAAADAAEKEQQRQERRMVRELNKLAVAAAEVRRAKLTEILARKTLPKGKAAAIAAFIATTMRSHHDLFMLNNSQGNAADLAAELLGGTDPLDALTAAATADRTQMINLAIVAGAHEAAMWKDAWRGVPMNPYTNRNSRVGWLRFLTETLGYELADVEKVIVGDLKAADVDID